jgi:type II secretory ATPase GspE/PulE/Tfp pilus assembly ATPase PilB-like protein
VTESLEIDEAIASLIANQKDTNEISHLFNHRSLNELLYEKVLDGTTSFEEYLSHEI